MDILLQKLFEPARWEYAIEVGVEKDMKKGELRKMCSPEFKRTLCSAILDDKYDIAPPHEAHIPKENGEFRTVYVNEQIDRVVLSIINDLLFEMFPDMIHESCKSYQHGVGTGKVVTSLSAEIQKAKGREIGWKADLSKYFDSVPIEYINNVFDEIDRKIGKSHVTDLVRRYYNSDLCFDIQGNLIHHYASLKQGCAVGSFLADVMLYDIDNKLSNMNGIYVRYSDDTCFVGNDYKLAKTTMEQELSKMSMKLNPKKVEMLSSERWFKFLGFNIKGSQITLSKSRVKTFQKEIEKRTIKRARGTFKSSLNDVNNFLYKGDGQYSWATSVLSVINVDKDIDTLNDFVLDALRATQTGKKRIGGLGSVNTLPDSTIVRGIGRNVTNNKRKTEKEVSGYSSIRCMRNALITDRNAYKALVRMM